MLVVIRIEVRINEDKGESSIIIIQEFINFSIRFTIFFSCDVLASLEGQFYVSKLVWIVSSIDWKVLFYRAQVIVNPKVLNSFIISVKKIESTFFKSDRSGLIIQSHILFWLLCLIPNPFSWNFCQIQFYISLIIYFLTQCIIELESKIKPSLTIILKI